MGTEKTSGGACNPSAQTTVVYLQPTNYISITQLKTSKFRQFAMYQSYKHKMIIIIENTPIFAQFKAHKQKRL